MPEKDPSNWLIVLAWLSQHSSTIGAGIASAAVAVMRTIYGGGTRQQTFLEAGLCTALTMGIIPILEYFGLPQAMATAAGVYIGFMGVKKIAALADRITEFKLPKRPE
jgi:lambda family phage holin